MVIMEGVGAFLRQLRISKGLKNRHDAVKFLHSKGVQKISVNSLSHMEKDQTAYTLKKLLQVIMAYQEIPKSDMEVFLLQTLKVHSQFPTFQQPNKSTAEGWKHAIGELFKSLRLAKKLSPMRLVNAINQAYRTEADNADKDLITSRTIEKIECGDTDLNVDSLTLLVGFFANVKKDDLDSLVLKVLMSILALKKDSKPQ